MDEPRDYHDIIGGAEQGDMPDAGLLCRLLSERFRMISMVERLPPHVTSSFGSIAGELRDLSTFIDGYRAATPKGGT